MSGSLAFRDVEFGYVRERPPVLRGVTTGVEAGESVAIIGANGAGKTTLTRLVVGLEQPWAGEVLVGGRSTRGRGPWELAESVAYVFQHPGRQLFARSVLEEVAYAPRMLRREQSEAEGVARSALGLVGLADVADVHPHDLPPGTQKLTALAAAVAQDPSVLILDEPTQGLDRAGLLRVAAVLRTLVDRGVTVLAVTHDLTLVAEAFGRVWVIGGGTLVADEPTDHLFATAATREELGLSLPPVPDLALRMGWGAGRFRIAAAADAVAALAGRGPGA